MPAPKRIFQLVIQDLGPGLQKQVRAPKRPVHLLLLDEASRTVRDLLASKGEKRLDTASWPTAQWGQLADAARLDRAQGLSPGLAPCLNSGFR